MNEKKMPLLFVGHGSPMNAIEDNQYTRTWEEIGKTLKKPKVILVISAHWFTAETKVQNEDEPQMIYDMYGFPQELYDVQYPVHGAPEIADEIQKLLGSIVSIDNSWGIDHGTWSVLVKMFPQADIPVLQLSVNANATPQEHYEIGKKLSSLRTEGVLILGSGNVVHNLRQVDWNQSGGFEWALDFDKYIKDAVVSHHHEKAISYMKHPFARLAVPTPDHFFPLLYTLGACDENDEVTVFNEDSVMGSLSMTSYLFQ